jgi:hypothetical protein
MRRRMRPLAAPFPVVEEHAYPSPEAYPPEAGKVGVDSDGQRIC